MRRKLRANRRRYTYAQADEGIQKPCYSFRVQRPHSSAPTQPLKQKTRTCRLRTRNHIDTRRSRLENPSSRTMRVTTTFVALAVGERVVCVCTSEREGDRIGLPCFSIRLWSTHKGILYIRARSSRSTPSQLCQFILQPLPSAASYRLLVPLKRCVGLALIERDQRVPLLSHCHPSPQPRPARRLLVQPGCPTLGRQTILGRARSLCRLLIRCRNHPFARQNPRRSLPTGVLHISFLRSVSDRAAAARTERSRTGLIILV